MKHQLLFIYIFTVLTWNQAIAADCDTCPPLSEIKVSQKGAEKLFELILTNTFSSIQNKIERVATFSDFNIDHSKCPKMKAYQAALRRENCVGMIDFRKYKNEVPDADAELTGYRASLTGLRLERLGMSLVTPVKCEDWNCHFTVKVSDLKVTGKLNAQYSDTNKEVFPESKVSVTANKNASLTYEVNMSIDPSTGKISSLETKNIPQGGSSSLNDLVHVKEGSSKISIGEKSLNYHMEFATKEDEKTDKANVYKEQYQSLKKYLTDDKWILQQYNKLKSNPFNKYRTNDTSRLSPAEIVSKIKGANQRWQVDGNYLDAFNKMPDEFYQILDSAGDQKNIAEAKYQAKKYGIDDFAAYSTLKNFEPIANMLLSDREFAANTLSPYIKSEMGPVIERNIQETLRDTTSHWDMISRVPIGNGDSVQMDTEFLVQEFSRAKKALKMNLYSKNINCYPSALNDEDDGDANYDIQTNFSVFSLQQFFIQATKEQKLKLCSVESKNDCKNGVQILINSPPKITCSNGKLLLDFQNNEVRPFNLFGAKAQSLVEVEVRNCQGAPCLKLANLKSQFIHLPFDGVLNRGLNKHFEQQNKEAIEIPHFNLNDVKTDKDCNAQFDWTIQN